MKNHIIKFSVLVSVLFLSACKTEKSNTKENDSSTKESLYFGQKPPGLIPEVFAPGIVSIDGRFEGTVSFSSELTAMYFAADNKDEETHIYFSKLEGNNWTPIKRVDFTNGKKNEEMHPFVSPDDKRIYFTAMDSAFADEKIWYVNRLGDSWSDAIMLDSPINDDLVFFPNQAKNGDLYYFINLGNTINTSLNEKGPRITPDGKYLFFGRDERDIEPGLANIYWVSTEVIEKLRPKH